MPSDAQLMQQVQAGRSDLFDELIVRHRPGLLRFAQSKLGDADRAEDAVQEALMAAFAARGTYDPRFAFSTWVYTIVLNTCRRQLRRRQRQVDARVDQNAPVDPVASPLERLLESEAQQQLAESLARLPEAEADALRLRFFGGLQFDQIALAMDSSVSGAKARVRRGLERLAAQLTDPMTTNEAVPINSTSDFPHSGRSEP